MDLLWTDFLNSMWHDWRGSGRSEDRLYNPEWLEEFTKEWQLHSPIPAKPDEFKQLLQLRELIDRMSAALKEGKSLTEEDIEKLNEIMKAGKLERHLVRDNEKYKVVMSPIKDDSWKQTMSDIAASFADTISDGDALRIRRCANPDCKWIFYDSTRNKSKIYCDNSLCGNLMKVRKFRAKKQK